MCVWLGTMYIRTQTFAPSKLKIPQINPQTKSDLDSAVTDMIFQAFFGSHPVMRQRKIYLSACCLLLMETERQNTVKQAEVNGQLNREIQMRSGVIGVKMMDFGSMMIGSSIFVANTRLLSSGMYPSSNIEDCPSTAVSPIMSIQCSLVSQQCQKGWQIFIHQFKKHLSMQRDIIFIMHL